MLLLLLIGFFALEPLGVPVSLVAAMAAFILWRVARKGAFTKEDGEAVIDDRGERVRHS